MIIPSIYNNGKITNIWNLIKTDKKYTIIIIAIIAVVSIFLDLSTFVLIIDQVILSNL